MIINYPNSSQIIKISLIYEDELIIAIKNYPTIYSDWLGAIDFLWETCWKHALVRQFYFEKEAGNMQTITCFHKYKSWHVFITKLHAHMSK